MCVSEQNQSWRVKGRWRQPLCRRPQLVSHPGGACFVCMVPWAGRGSAVHRELISPTMKSLPVRGRRLALMAALLDRPPLTPG